MLTLFPRRILQGDFSRKFSKACVNIPNVLWARPSPLRTLQAKKKAKEKEILVQTFTLRLRHRWVWYPRVTAMYIVLNERSNIQLTLINGKWCCTLSTIRAVAWPPWEVLLHASEGKQMLSIDSLRMIVSLQGNGARECAWQGKSCFAKSYKILQHFHSLRWLFKRFYCLIPLCFQPFFRIFIWELRLVFMNWVPFRSAVNRMCWKR